MNNHELWTRAQVDMKETVQRLKRELEINEVFLAATVRELKKYPKPKQKPNPICA